MNKKNISIFILILCVLLLISCKPKDSIKREHELFNNELYPYLIIKATPQFILNYEGEKQLINNYDVYIHIKGTEGVKKVTYTLGSVNYINEPHLLGTNEDINLFTTKQILYNETIGGGGFKEVYGTFLYEYQNKIKDLYFYEEVIKLEDDDINSDDYTDLTRNDFVKLNFEIFEMYDKYEINYDFEIFSDQKFHFDFQSWFLTTTKQIYPFVGIYNYNLHHNNIKITNNFLYKDVAFDYLYIRIHFYDSLKQLHYFTWKIEVEQLLQS